MTQRFVRHDIHYKIENEELLQLNKWGEQNHNNSIWYAILGEEFGEVGKALLENKNIESEIIQVAAVCISWLDCIERNRKTAFQQKR